MKPTIPLWARNNVAPRISPVVAPKAKPLWEQANMKLVTAQKPLDPVSRVLQEYRVSRPQCLKKHEAPPVEVSPPVIGPLPPVKVK